MTFKSQNFEEFRPLKAKIVTNFVLKNQNCDKKLPHSSVQCLTSTDNNVNEMETNETIKLKMIEYRKRIAIGRSHQRLGTFNGSQSRPNVRHGPLRSVTGHRYGRRHTENINK